MVNKLRFDLVFSYWIFLWYVLYILNITSYNPKIGLLLAIIVNLIVITIMIYYMHQLSVIISFCLINLFIKIIPFISLIDTRYKLKDFYALIILFIIFLLWRKIHTTNDINNTIDWLKNKKQPGDLTYYLNKVIEKII
jgi:CBS domain containing-hemolysin-like protein